MSGRVKHRTRRLVTTDPVTEPLPTSGPNFRPPVMALDSLPVEPHPAIAALPCDHTLPRRRRSNDGLVSACSSCGALHLGIRYVTLGTGAGLDTTHRTWKALHLLTLHQREEHTP